MVSPLAFDREWREGDRERATEMAREYIDEHREALAPLLEPMSLEDVVSLIDQYRKVGREEDRIVADMWLLVNYPPQNISGTFHLGGKPAVDAAEAIIAGDS